MLFKKLFCLFFLIVSFFLDCFVFSSNFEIFENLNLVDILDKIESLYKRVPKFNGTLVIRYSDKVDVNTTGIKKKINTFFNSIKDDVVFLMKDKYLENLNVSFLDPSFEILKSSEDIEYLELSFLSDGFVYSEDIKEGVKILKEKYKNKDFFIDGFGSGEKCKVILSSLFDEDKMQLSSDGKDFLKGIVQFINDYLIDYNVEFKFVFFLHQLYDFGPVYELFKKKMLKQINSKINSDFDSDVYLLVVPKNIKDLSLLVFDDRLDETSILKELSLNSSLVDIRKRRGSRDFVNNKKRGNAYLKETSTLPKKYIYFNGENDVVSFYPTGWLGDFMDVNVDFNYDDYGKKCIRVTYKPTNSGFKGWFALVWQYPPNNWGDKREEGVNLTGYKKLVFHAKGEKGNEVISEVKVGGNDNTYGDTSLTWIGRIKLTRVWTKYEINLAGKNLSNIISGLVLILTKHNAINGMNIYLSDIYYE